MVYIVEPTLMVVAESDSSQGCNCWSDESCWLDTGNI